MIYYIIYLHSITIYILKTKTINYRNGFGHTVSEMPKLEGPLSVLPTKTPKKPKKKRSNNKKPQNSKKYVPLQMRLPKKEELQSLIKGHQRQIDINGILLAEQPIKQKSLSKPKQKAPQLLSLMHLDQKNVIAGYSQSIGGINLSVLPNQEEQIRQRIENQRINSLNQIKSLVSSKMPNSNKDSNDVILRQILKKIKHKSTSQQTNHTNKNVRAIKEGEQYTKDGSQNQQKGYNIYSASQSQQQRLPIKGIKIEENYLKNDVDKTDVDKPVLCRYPITLGDLIASLRSKLRRKKLQMQRMQEGYPPEGLWNTDPKGQYDSYLEDQKRVNLYQEMRKDLKNYIRTQNVFEDKVNGGNNTYEWINVNDGRKVNGGNNNYEWNYGKRVIGAKKDSNISQPQLTYSTSNAYQYFDYRNISKKFITNIPANQQKQIQSQILALRQKCGTIYSHVKFCRQFNTRVVPYKQTKQFYPETTHLFILVGECYYQHTYEFQRILTMKPITKRIISSQTSNKAIQFSRNTNSIGIINYQPISQVSQVTQVNLKSQSNQGRYIAPQYIVEIFQIVPSTIQNWNKYYLEASLTYFIRQTQLPISVSIVKRNGFTKTLKTPNQCSQILEKAFSRWNQIKLYHQSKLTHSATKFTIGLYMFMCLQTRLDLGIVYRWLQYKGYNSWGERHQFFRKTDNSKDHRKHLLREKEMLQTLYSKKQRPNQVDNIKLISYVDCLDAQTYISALLRRDFDWQLIEVDSFDSLVASANKSKLLTHQLSTDSSNPYIQVDKNTQGILPTTKLRKALCFYQQQARQFRQKVASMKSTQDHKAFTRSPCQLRTIWKVIQEQWLIYLNYSQNESKQVPMVSQSSSLQDNSINKERVQNNNYTSNYQNEQSKYYQNEQSIRKQLIPQQIVSQTSQAMFPINLNNSPKLFQAVQNNLLECNQQMSNQIIQVQNLNSTNCYEVSSNLLPSTFPKKYPSQEVLNQFIQIGLKVRDIFKSQTNSKSYVPFAVENEVLQIKSDQQVQNYHFNVFK